MQIRDGGDGDGGGDETGVKKKSTAGAEFKAFTKCEVRRVVLGDVPEDSLKENNAM